MRLSPETWRAARALIASRLGFDVSGPREADLEWRFVSACPPNSDPEGWVAALAGEPDSSPAWRRLAGLLTVGETYFFRDAGALDVIRREFLMPLIAARRAAGDLRLRIWSAGCSTGEEPYSLAILLDGLLPDRSAWVITLLATDINIEALRTARRGLYRDWSFRGTPGDVRNRYFTPRSGDQAELVPEIRRMVTFAPLNLARDGYPDVLTNTVAMDLVVCRNVLMYLARNRQRDVVAHLAAALQPGGALLVAAVETSVDLPPGLTPVSVPEATFYRKGAGVARGPAAEPVAVAFHTESASPVRPLESGAPAGGAADCALPDRVAILRKARALADQGRLTEANALCVEAVRRDSLDPEAYMLLATISQELGRLDLAREALGRAIYVAPDSASAHFLLGALLLQEGEEARGRRCFDTVTRLLGQMLPGEMVAGADGLTAGRLLEMAREYIEATAGQTPPR